MEQPRILVAIPLYRSPELIEDLFDSLIAVADEIDRLSAQIVLINDSPDCEQLADTLDHHLPRLRRAMEVEMIANESNLGFVRTANRAFRIAIDQGLDILLLNSDARPRPGAFAEMAAVARLDPMIGFVSPRSNNATICNSPYPAAWRAGSPEEAYRHHKAIEGFLPRYSYVPTAVGFCLYVRFAIIDEFGSFDEIYADGYNEENDLIRRCNRRGYRAVLANHAYVYHLGGASFGNSPISTETREERNRAILNDRYPEYSLAIRRYFEGPEHRAQALLAGLVPLASGKLRILFDCRTLTCSHKGSFEHCRDLLTAFASLAASRFEIFALCERSAFEFHHLDKIPDLRFCVTEDVHDRPFAVAMRLVQPFLLEDIVTLADYAPITGFLILDTIAMDCQQLDTHGLDILWRFMTETASLIGYNSEFTKAQFKRRIDVWPHVTEFVSRCSTDIADYAATSASSDESDHILVIGNDYPHKHVADTITAIQSLNAEATIDTIGCSIDPNGNIQPGGSMTPEEVGILYNNAKVVVYPSHYEGFGLPILHALARQKPIVARDLVSAREIADRVAGAANLHLATSTADIAKLAINEELEWQKPSSVDDNRSEGWREAAKALLAAFDTAVARIDYITCRRQQATIIGHRARLDAERRFHDDAAIRGRMETDMVTITNSLATSEARHEELRTALIQARFDGDGLRQMAEKMEKQRNVAIEEVRQTRDRLDHARLEASQSAAREWNVRIGAQKNSEFLASLKYAPRFDITTNESKGGEVPAPTVFVWPIRRPRFRIRLGDPKPARRPASVRDLQLELSEIDLHPAELSDFMLQSVDLLSVGGRLELVMPHGRLVDQSGRKQMEHDAQTLMQMSGCAMTGLSSRRDRIRMEGIKIWDADWCSAEPADDRLFLRVAYHNILRREPDHEGEIRYLKELAGDMSRNAVIRSLLSSRERFDLVADVLNNGHIRLPELYR